MNAVKIQNLAKNLKAMADEILAELESAADKKKKINQAAILLHKKYQKRRA